MIVCIEQKSEKKIKVDWAEWKRQAAVLLLLGSLFLFWGFGNGKLWDQDETTYAEVVRSFPSGHSADAFVSGVFLFYLLRH